MTKRFFFLLLAICTIVAVSAQPTIKLKKKDRKRDIAVITTKGTMVLRLSNATPLHRDNFLRLVKSHFYDSILFHRVIKNFMIQAGDPQSKNAAAHVPLGNGGLHYTIPAEFKPNLFHVTGALAAARQGDDVNPKRESSSTQFYIVQGRKFTAAELDSVERVRLQGYHLPAAHREVYEEYGGTPQLDQHYTVFGQLVFGFDVLDSIATTEVSRGPDRDRPLEDVRIIKMKLIKRKNYGEHWVGRLIGKAIGY